MLSNTTMRKSKSRTVIFHPEVLEKSAYTVNYNLEAREKSVLTFNDSFADLEKSSSWYLANAVFRSRLHYPISKLIRTAV